jgi:23S rRNA pseudouridine2605 synthase
MAEMRLQKVIAAAGIASRRQAERLIQAGRVRVDGKTVTKLGTQVDPGKCKIEVDGKALPAPGKPIYLMLNKPRGVLSAAKDGRGRKTVMDLLGDRAGPSGDKRVFHVGRLDYHSEGLLLLTNDGEMAMNLTHPSSQVPRIYRARVSGQPSKTSLDRLVSGVKLEDGLAKALDARFIKRNPRSTWVELSVTEGRNRLIRRLFEAIGHTVQRLVRTEYAGLGLGDLPPGRVRELTTAEISNLHSWRRIPAAGQRKKTGRTERK